MKKLLGSTLIVSSLLFSSVVAHASTQAIVAERVVQTGIQYMGTPYQYGAQPGNTSSFDCSSFSQYVFAQHGIQLPRTSTEQYRTGTAVQRNQLQKGDLVFFDTNYDGIVNHLGIYVGNGQMLHASSSVGVAIHSFAGNPYWEPRYVGARRVLSEQSAQQLQPQAGTSTYTVQSGDSLWLISQKTNTTILELMEWNNLSSATIIPGQKLKVRTAPSTGAPITAVQSGTHKVVAGESLFTISKQYGITIQNLKDWNRLSSDTIYVGQVLQVKSSQTVHIVNSGESLWILSTRYGVTIQQLKDANQLVSDEIRIGQHLQIPRA